MLKLVSGAAAAGTSAVLCDRAVFRRLTAATDARQKPRYPEWDENWDGLGRSGARRHILLVRHGHYDETGLTNLGRLQAEVTGMRIKELMENGVCVSLVSSSLKRAVETADVIASSVPAAPRSVDAALVEGWPVQPIPGQPRPHMYADGARLDKAFHKYFHRGGAIDDEYVVIVCHANVIRYLFLRALQLPPEAWLRLCTMNCSITHLTITPDGLVSARSLGDVGHLPIDLVSFSEHHGYNWG